jgi:hypothetical protein
MRKLRGSAMKLILVDPMPELAPPKSGRSWRGGRIKIIDGKGFDLERIDPIEVETLNQATRLIEFISIATIKIEGQIEAYGNDDSDGGFWLRRAKAKMHYLKVTRNWLQNRCDEFKRCETAAAILARDKARERLFCECARRYLPRETYAMLWEKVHSTQGGEK